MNENIDQNKQENAPSSKEYEIFRKNLIEQLDALRKGDILSFWREEIKPKMDILMDKFGEEEVLKYAAWHALSGSTITPDIPIQFYDFPGDDSVELWLEELEQKLKSEEEKE
jgi:hypothetical protein